MKTRSGFVSNSSSTSFILAIPSDLELTDKEWEEYIDDYIPKMAKLKKSWNKLKKDGFISTKDVGFNIITNMCAARGYDMLQVFTGADDNYRAYNIFAGKYGNKLLGLAKKEMEA